MANIGSNADISGDYQIFTGDVTLNGTLQFTDGAYNYTFDSSGNLNVSAVPEPSTYALVGAAVLGGLVLLRRRKKSHAG